MGRNWQTNVTWYMYIHLCITSLYMWYLPLIYVSYELYYQIWNMKVAGKTYMWHVGNFQIKYPFSISICDTETSSFQISVFQFFLVNKVIELTIFLFIRRYQQMYFIPVGLCVWHWQTYLIPVGMCGWHWHTYLIPVGLCVLHSHTYLIHVGLCIWHWQTTF